MSVRKAILCTLSLIASSVAFSSTGQLPPSMHATSASTALPEKRNLIMKQTNKRIFLTGATGMVGSRFICDALKADPSLRIGCLVRGDCAAKRLETKIKESDMSWTKDMQDCIIAVKGDVTEPNLGMMDRDYQYWVRQSDAVVHLAADIRLARGEKSASVNNKACEKVFDFVRQGWKHPSLHFMSSIAACALLPSAYANETLDHPVEACFPGGYGEQKWHAEQYLTDQAAHSNVSVCIYRAPFILNRHGLQCWSLPDLVFKIAAIIGAVPESASYLPMHSLDTVSQCLVINVLRTMYHSRKTCGSAEVIHLADTRHLTWDQQVGMLNAAGLGVSTLPWEEYKRRLQVVRHLDRYIGKLYAALPLVKATFQTVLCTLLTLKMKQICWEDAGMDLANANLNVKDLRGSIDSSIRSLLENVNASKLLEARYISTMKGERKSSHFHACENLYLPPKKYAHIQSYAFSITTTPALSSHKPNVKNGRVQRVSTCSPSAQG